MKTTAATALLLLALLPACKDEPKIVDEAAVNDRVKSYLVANAANLQPPERLTPPVLKTYGVPEHEQARFLEVYRRFLTYRDHLPQELQRADPAIRLTLDLSLDDPGDSLLGVTEPQRLRADDPAYLAYQLLLGPGVDNTQLAEPGYVAQLAGWFQVEPRLIQRGLWIALQHDLDGLASSLVGLLERTLKQPAAPGVDRFVDDVLVLFLTYVSRGLTLSEPNEVAIAEAYGRLVGDQKGFEQTFEQLRYHLNGEEPTVPRLPAFNASLVDKKLYLYLLPGQVTLQRPLAYRIDVGRKELTTVRAVAARGLAMGRLPQGCWPYADREVVLPADGVAAQRDVHRALIAHGTLPMQVTEDLERLWREQGLDLDTDKVRGLFQGLASKAFEQADDATLLADLFFDAALLQARCLTDLGPAAGLDELDRAIASHGAQVVLARRPELQLLGFVQGVQALRLASSDIAQNTRLDALLKSLWKLAADRNGEVLDRAGLQKAVRELHDAHRTARGARPLPELDRFDRDVVQAKLAPAPAFSLP